MKLIINADDFGISRGQNFAIIDCYTQGVVKSTTLLATTPAFEHACQLAHQHTGLDIGVHLSLDLGEPVSPSAEIPSLLAEGRFRRYASEAYQIDVEAEEAYIEWRAQIEKVLAAGIQLTHMDSHHHIHMMTNLFPVYVRLAREYDLAIRFHPRKWYASHFEQFAPLLEGLRRADLFLNTFYMHNLTPAFFGSIDADDDAIVEMMCHPAYLDQWLLTNSSYNVQRTVEAETLQAPETKTILSENKIEVISFQDLPEKVLL